VVIIHLGSSLLGCSSDLPENVSHGCKFKIHAARIEADSLQ